MAFQGMNWATGFFDMPGANASSSEESLRTGETLASASTSFSVSTPQAASTPLSSSALNSSRNSRPPLAPLHIPPSFSPIFRSTPFNGSPDSGYGSAASHRTPAFTDTSNPFRFGRPSPISPTLRRTRIDAVQPVDLPELEEWPPSDDEEDNEDVSQEKQGDSENSASRLLKLYKAGHVIADIGENGCWRLQCNRSLPKRTPLSASGHFYNLETHQNGNKCTYSPKFTRATTAPPQETPASTEMDVDEDNLEFQYGRSSSAPPEDSSRFASHPNILPSLQPSRDIITDTSVASARTCTGVHVEWNIEAGSVGWTFPWHRVIQSGETETQTEFFRVEIDSAGATRAFSKECTGPPTATMTDICAECAKIPRRLLELEDMAANTKPHTNYRFLNYLQLTNLLTDKDSELRRCANLTRKLRIRISAKSGREHLAAGIPISRIPPPFARVAGPDEGVDDQYQQMGVRYRIPVRSAPTAKAKAAGKGKAATGTADTSSERPPKKKRKRRAQIEHRQSVLVRQTRARESVRPPSVRSTVRVEGGGGVQPPSGVSEVDIGEFRHAYLLSWHVAVLRGCTLCAGHIWTVDDCQSSEDFVSPVAGGLGDAGHEGGKERKSHDQMFVDTAKQARNRHNISPVHYRPTFANLPVLHISDFFSMRTEQQEIAGDRIHLNLVYIGHLSTVDFPGREKLALVVQILDISLENLNLPYRPRKIHIVVVDLERGIKKQGRKWIIFQRRCYEDIHVIRQRQEWQVPNLEKIDGLHEELEVVVVCAVLGEQDQVAEGHFGWRDQGWVIFYMFDTLEGPRDTGGLDPPGLRIMELGGPHRQLDQGFERRA
ncbi:hypothetical protein B0H17DRAFT_1286415 [Mycena rosella]|uniref:Uncharacterized protein n=1 Tax=Mycena rosella TaxID=1033263 RepID=A0AAD7BNW2_MYCRO|nr:hypothetical protein B0H17DRAFT_1286415 [Mycena rosella]